MLKIAHSIKELEFSQLMRVYMQSNAEYAERSYPHLRSSERQLQAEQTVYAYLRDDFFLTEKVFYALWLVNERYASALRMEPYKDGLLLEALETVPDERGKGYAKLLVKAVLEHLQAQGKVKIYSHVGKKNAASLAVHHDCGFKRLYDHASYIDGSVSHNAYTLCYNID